MNKELDFLINLSKEANEDKHEAMDRLNPSEKLLIAYDGIFHKTNKIFNEKDREIMTKTRLVEINEDANDKKRTTILALKNLFFTLILSFFVIWAHLSGFLSLAATIVIIIIIISFFTVDFIRNIASTIDSDIINQSTKTGNELKQFFENSYMNAAGISDYSCQEYCPQEEENNNAPGTGPIIPRAKPRYIRQDSQRDVWLKGDLPDSTYTIRDKGIEYNLDGAEVTGFNYDKDLYISPSGMKIYRGDKNQLEDNREKTRRIIPIDKKYATYYNCEFMGGKNSKDKLPYKKYYEYTTIPCDNYPGFIEKDRYICPNDPKTDGVANCKKINSN